jgi:5-hydroxyisourate hydrolase
MSRITTHVLDTVQGKPAEGIPILLEASRSNSWALIRDSATDEDGRCRDLANNAERGRYRMTFVIGPYLRKLGRSSVYPEISVTFECDGIGHYHLPLLLSDNSYTTYRGS